MASLLTPNSSRADARRNHHLTSASVSMLAIGGTIGTGLFFSVSTVLRNGPFQTLVAMSFLSFLVMLILEMTAELAVFMPGNGSICKFQFVFLSEPLGLANNLIYWASWGLTFALELSILVSTSSYWDAEFVENYQTALIFCIWLVLTVFNLLPVDLYGKIEFWIALIKVVAIFCWILFVSARLAWSGSLFHTYTADLPSSFFGAFDSPTSYVVRFINSLVFTSFIFQSVESIAITTGDIEKPQETIPQVTRLIFVRIVVFYLISVILLTLTIAYNDDRLSIGGDSAKDTLASSPFLISLINCGLSDNSLLLSMFNFIIFSAILSAANSNIYFGSRCLQAVCETYSDRNKLAKTFEKANAIGVPIASVLGTSAIGLFALLLKFQTIATVFNFLLTCCASAGLLMWCLVGFSYVRFRKTLEYNEIDRAKMLYRSEWDLRFWAPLASVSIVVVLMCNGLSTYWNFSIFEFVGAYSTPAVFVALWALFEINSGKGLRKIQEINIFGGDFRWNDDR
ncbi:hypothetical protein FDK38_004395 [Candidozyma auris]|nr:hypothetical protein FDK38_004395 [[Candida] auris]